MANPSYVRNSDGAAGDNGSTWALAKDNIENMLEDGTNFAAGYTMYISDNHSENYTIDTTFSSPGLDNTPCYIICADDTSDPEPPTTLATSAVVTSNANCDLIFTGSLYVYGISFTTGTGTGTASIIQFGESSNLGGFVFDNCAFYIKVNSTNGRVNIGNLSSGGRTDVLWRNCTLRFYAAGNTIWAYGGNFVWQGGSYIATDTATVTSLFTWVSISGGYNRQSRILIEDVDLSAITSGGLVGIGGIPPGATTIIRNCKLNSGISYLFGSTDAKGWEVLIDNCVDQSGNIIEYYATAEGSVTREETIKRTSGASDGTTAHSWKIATGSSIPEEWVNVFRSREIVIWNDTTGSSVTMTVHFVHDTNVAAGQGSGTSYDFTDAEVWLEATYFDTSGSTLGKFKTNQRSGSGWFQSAADITDDTSEGWTTTGLTTVVKQKLALTFTPQKKGYVHLRVCVGVAGKTIYVCPKVDVS